MKKLLFCLFFFYSAIFIAQNNESFFEFKYHPNSEYLSEFQKSTKLKVTKRADKETLKYFDSVGVKRFQRGNKKETYTVSTKTEELKGNKTMSIEILAYDFDYNGTLNKEKIDDKFKMKSLQARGYVDIKNELTINELLIDNKPSEKDNEFIRSLENKRIGIDFPKHKISIGETVFFDYTIYYSHPLDGNNLYNTKMFSNPNQCKKRYRSF